MSTKFSISERVVIDTSFWVSLYFLGDSNHSKAFKHLEAFEDSVSEAYVTELIFSEVATLLSQRLGKKSFSNLYEDNSSLLAQASFFKDVRNIFELTKSDFLTLSDKNISFVDLNTALVARDLDADVITFDGHFKKLGKKYGFKVFP